MSSDNLSFFEHLSELRKRLFYICILIFILTGFSYFYYEQLLNILLQNIDIKLFTNTIAEGFVTKIKLSLFSAIFFSIPFIIIQILLFLFPALKSNEKLFIIIAFISGYLLFISGIYFAYSKIIPLTITYLRNSEFYPKNVGIWLNYSDFIKFIYQMLLGFGVAFQFPIIIFFLIKLKIVSKKKLLQKSKYVIVLCFIIGAILTPPDWVSQTMLSLPLIFLYYFSILFCYVFRIGI